MVFVFSAIAKLIAIDRFEVYVYSFGFIPLNASFILARVCIAGEVMLGIGLASNLCGRLVNVATLIVLIFFSLFLCYAALIGRNDSCQCFGTMLEFNPTQSLVKNAVLIIWTLVVSKVPSFKWRPKEYLWIALATFCLILPFYISKPDHWVFDDSEKGIPYNKALLEEQAVTNPLLIESGIPYGNKIVAFVSPRCPYCQMCVEKLQTLQQRYNLPDSSIIYIIPQQPEPAEINYVPVVISREEFSLITYGQRPVIVLFSQGIPIQSYHYRAINEKDFHAFLSSSF